MSDEIPIEEINELIEDTKSEDKEELYFNRILEETGWTKTKLNKQIKEKQEELKDLISKEGALLIISKELDVEVNTNPIQEEINELTEELQEENKEIYEIMQSTLYKTLFQVLKRVTLKIEIVNIDNISTATPGTKTATKTPTKKTAAKKEKKEDLTLNNVENKHETELAILLKNEDDKVTWIPKKAFKSFDSISKTAVISGWFVEKIEWKEEEPFEQ